MADFNIPTDPTTAAIKLAGMGAQILPHVMKTTRQEKPDNDVVDKTQIGYLASIRKELEELNDNSETQNSNIYGSIDELKDSMEDNSDNVIQFTRKFDKNMKRVPEHLEHIMDFSDSMASTLINLIKTSEESNEHLRKIERNTANDNLDKMNQYKIGLGAYNDNVIDAISKYEKTRLKGNDSFVKNIINSIFKGVGVFSVMDKLRMSLSGKQSNGELLKSAGKFGLKQAAILGSASMIAGATGTGVVGAGVAGLGIRSLISGPGTARNTMMAMLAPKLLMGFGGVGIAAYLLGGKDGFFTKLKEKMTGNETFVESIHIFKTQVIDRIKNLFNEASEFVKEVIPDNWKPYLDKIGKEFKSLGELTENIATGVTSAATPFVASAVGLTKFAIGKYDPMAQQKAHEQYLLSKQKQAEAWDLLTKETQKRNDLMLEMMDVSILKTKDERKQLEERKELIEKVIREKEEDYQKSTKQLNKDYAEWQSEGTTGMGRTLTGYVSTFFGKLKDLIVWISTRSWDTFNRWTGEQIGKLLNFGQGLLDALDMFGEQVLSLGATKIDKKLTEFRQKIFTMKQFIFGGQEGELQKMQFDLDRSEKLIKLRQERVKAIGDKMLANQIENPVEAEKAQKRIDEIDKQINDVRNIDFNKSIAFPSNKYGIDTLHKEAESIRSNTYGINQQGIENKGSLTLASKQKETEKSSYDMEHERKKSEIDKIKLDLQTTSDSLIKDINNLKDSSIGKSIEEIQSINETMIKKGEELASLKLKSEIEIEKIQKEIENLKSSELSYSDTVTKSLQTKSNPLRDVTKDRFKQANEDYSIIGKELSIGSRFLPMGNMVSLLENMYSVGNKIQYPEPNIEKQTDKLNSKHNELSSAKDTLETKNKSAPVTNYISAPSTSIVRSDTNHYTPGNAFSEHSESNRSLWK